MTNLNAPAGMLNLRGLQGLSIGDRNLNLTAFANPGNLNLGGSFALGLRPNRNLNLSGLLASPSPSPAPTPSLTPGPSPTPAPVGCNLVSWWKFQNVAQLGLDQTGTHSLNLTFGSVVSVVDPEQGECIEAASGVEITGSLNSFNPYAPTGLRRFIVMAKFKLPADAFLFFNGQVFDVAAMTASSTGFVDAYAAVNFGWSEWAILTVDFPVDTWLSLKFEVTPDEEQGLLHRTLTVNDQATSGTALLEQDYYFMGTPSVSIVLAAGTRIKDFQLILCN